MIMAGMRDQEDQAGGEDTGAEGGLWGREGRERRERTDKQEGLAKGGRIRGGCRGGGRVLWKGGRESRERRDRRGTREEDSVWWLGGSCVVVVPCRADRILCRVVARVVLVAVSAAVSRRVACLRCALRQQQR